MTELMKRYEAETGNSALEYMNGFGYVSTDAYVTWLEAQLTWRPVSEKPEKSDRYLIKYRQGKIVKRFIADYDTVDGWNIPLPDVELIKWLPIPPAPEGE